MGRNYLHSAGGTGGALADVEETGAPNATLPPLTRGPAQVNDHWLALEQAHQVGGLLALSDTDLREVTPMDHGSHMTISPNSDKRLRFLASTWKPFHAKRH